jgi:hypothetical protein
MSLESDVTRLVLHINVEDADADYRDQLTRQLRRELEDLDAVETAELVMGGTAMPGSKSGDVVAIGQIAIAVLPALAPKLVEFVQAWALRGQTRSVEFEGEIGTQKVKFKGSAKDFNTLLESLRPKAISAGNQEEVPQ